MKPILDPKKVAAVNPAVDTAKLEKLDQVRQLLESAGLLKKPEYRVSPPLGGGEHRPARMLPVRIFQRARKIS